MKLTPAHADHVRDLAGRKFAVVRPCRNGCVHVAAFCRTAGQADAVLIRLIQAEGVKIGWVVVPPRDD